MVIWQWKRFQDLSINELYDILALRQLVFSVEQKLTYLDADGRDVVSYHLLGSKSDDKDRLCAYLRVVPAGYRFEEYSIGRVIIHPQDRGIGLGKKLMQEAIVRMSETFGDIPIRISALYHLERFYQSFGFVTQGPPYEAVSVPHIDMLRPAASCVHR